MSAKRNSNVVFNESDDENKGDVFWSSKRKRKQPYVESDADETSDSECEDDVKASPKNSSATTVTLRSSERLRRKSQNRRVMPSREDVLNKIPDQKKSDSTTSLRRRNLVNDFVKGSSRYVTDKTDIFESSDGEISDFIDDSEVIESVKIHSRSRRTKKGKGNFQNDLGRHLEDDKKAVKRAKGGRGTRSGLNQESNSNSDVHSAISDEEEDPELAKRAKETSEMVKTQSLNRQMRKSSLDSNVDDATKSRPTLRCRTKSAKKEKEEELLAKLCEKRRLKSSQANENDVNFVKGLHVKEEENSEEEVSMSAYSSVSRSSSDSE